MLTVDSMPGTTAQTPEMDVKRPVFECMFDPRSVAVIGATDREGSVGRTLLTNLRAPQFHGKVFAVNPKHKKLMQHICYPSIGKVPGVVDLAVIVTPAPTVPALVRECVDAGVRSAVVISAGFKERGAQGVELERQIQAELRRGSMRLLGPNCLGLMKPVTAAAPADQPPQFEHEDP